MDLKILVVLLVGIVVDVGVYGSIENRQDAFELAKKGLTEYLATGKHPSYLDYALRNYQLPHIFRSHVEEPQEFDSGVCLLCQLAAEALILQRRLGMSEVQLAAEASYLCTTFGIENQNVCDGVIKLNVGVFAYIIDNKPDLSGQRICSLLLQTVNCDRGSNYEWTVDIPEGETIDKPKASGSNTFNVLHVSDIHYDPLYTPGKSNKCGEPLCCQVDQINGTDATDTCGYWADYTDADVPMHTVRESLGQTVGAHDFDYVYYTGDFVSHRVWSTSIESNTDVITTISDLFREYYTVPVYPVLGNHEPHPLNVWSSDDETDKTLSTQWLFDLIAEQWSDWLTDDAIKTILKGGYYTVSPREGFRIIALNNNVCYIVNWWLMNEDEDPYGQLAWLVKTLTDAENNGESVHILSHIPTGSSECLEVWSREYGKIVERFANTITGQFNGHTHKDEFAIYYSSSKPIQAINSAWNGASITPFSRSNPSYKLYQIDSDTFDVLDFEEWTFNLTLANSDPDQPVDWYKLYSFKEAYGLNSVEPGQLDRLVNKMAADHTLLDQYYYYKFRHSDVALQTNCDGDCQKDILCSIVTTSYGTTDTCERLKILYDENS